MTQLGQLEKTLRDMGPVAVAVSGGVDSMTLVVVAHRVNPASRMYHALSPAVPGAATDRVRHYAEKEGWQLRLIEAGEIHDPRYVENPANRCYFCKTNLYDAVTSFTELTVVSGTNTDDLGDYRPGLIAAEEHAVRHPYVEAGISKAELREIAGELGLADLKDLPAAPCLSSRVATGIAIDAALLPVINEVEEALWVQLADALPLDGVRCRIRHGQLGIEVESGATIDPGAGYAIDAVQKTREIFTAAGYGDLAQDIVVEPYKRGRAFIIDALAVK